MNRCISRRASLACVLATTGVALAGAGAAHAAISPVPNDPLGAKSLALSMFADAGIVGAPAFAARPGDTAATGDGLTVFPTRGPSFGILSTGHVGVVDDPNTSTATTGSFADVGRGATDHDVTTVAIPFVARTGSNCLTMDFQFLSEEYPEYVGTRFNDAFIAELDTSTWTTVGDSDIVAPDNFAFDGDGEVVSVNAVGLGGFSSAAAAGTTFDGATGLLRASKVLTPGSHVLYLSIFDQGDRILDSAAFIDNIRVGFVANPSQNCRAGAQVANFSLGLVPDTATKGVGETHTVTATLTDDGGVPIAGKTVEFTRSGANSGTDTAVTAADGTATLTYLGTSAGTDAISAVFDADGDGTAEATDSAEATWENRYALDATPETATRSVGDTHTVTAVLDNGGIPQSGRHIIYSVTGANPGVYTRTTAPDGTASLTYTGTNIGVDTIVVAFDDEDDDWTADASDTVTVEFVNQPPDCSAATASVTELRQNNHAFRPVTIGGMTDPDGDSVAIAITSVRQDEVLNGLADGNTDIDARTTGASDTVEVRAERSGLGDGRVYEIAFSGDDGRGGTCTGSVLVTVPHDQRGAAAVDSGDRYDSFGS